MPETLLTQQRNDFSDKYNTKLTKDEEIKFYVWAKQNDRLNDIFDYDIKGAWKEISSGKMKESENNHLGDKYKKPNHPTFSTQSKYHGVDGYVGGIWTEKNNGSVEFTPSRTNIQNLSANGLKRYFAQNEKDVVLNLPYTLEDMMFPSMVNK